MSQDKHSLIRRSVVAGGIYLTMPVVFGQPQTARILQAAIRTDVRVVTLVNVFTVESGALPSLLDVLRDGTETFFSQMPGFVSSSVLAARDGRRAINYSQWRSREDIAVFRRDPRFAPYIERLRSMATMDGHEYDVVYVNSV